MTTTPCQSGPELWVSDLTASRHEAMALCKPCHQLADCLAGAIARREMFGVWGGKDFSHATTRPTLPPKPEKPINHGTEGGYKAHRRRDEPACPSCKQAQAQARARGRRAS